MPLKDIDQFYFKQEEPLRSYMLAIRQIIRTSDEFEETWKYKTPCFECSGKFVGYLWIDKKTKWPYLAILRSTEIDHSKLVKRKGVKA